MISVCMAVKNGAPYVGEQVDSILCQLSFSDELIISDDHSVDSTLDIVRSFNDPRVRVISSPRHGVANNFEFALSHSSGDFIFLSDQDDVWHPNKVSTMLPYFHDFDLVVCDCTLISDEGSVLCDSFFEWNKSGKGFLRNLISNSYMGCCMGFSKRVLMKALPFPKKISIHDFWIGMVAEAHFRPVFLKDKLVSHRIHRANASTSGGPSNIPPLRRVRQRYQLVRNLISRSL